MWPRVSVVVPTLNESRNLPAVFARLPGDVYEVIVVDGHSVDGTPVVARLVTARCPYCDADAHRQRQCARVWIRCRDRGIIAMIDADGSTDPGEIPRFVAALLDGADFAKGSRFAKGGGSSDITRLRMLGNRALCAAVNLRCGTRHTDLCYGFNAFWRRHVPVLGLNRHVAGLAYG